MNIEEKNAQVVVDALIARVRQLEMECNYKDIQIGELKKELAAKGEQKNA